MTNDTAAQLYAIRSLIERRHDAIRQKENTSIEELKWLNKALGVIPEPSLMQLAKQTRFLIERVTVDEKKEAFDLITSGYCVTCGDFLQGGCGCSGREPEWLS
jgi:hypothetical protein